MPDVDLRALRALPCSRVECPLCVGLGADDAGDGELDGGQGDVLVHIGASMFDTVADTIREMATRIDDPSTDEWQAWTSLVQWLSESSGALSKTYRMVKDGTHWRYQLAYLCNCVMLSSHLKGMAGLSLAMERALRAALPPAFANQVLSTLREGQLPSTSTIKRHRLTPHCAVVRLTREQAASMDGPVTCHTLGQQPATNADITCARVY